MATLCRSREDLQKIDEEREFRAIVRAQQRGCPLPWGERFSGKRKMTMAEEKRSHGRRLEPGELSWPTAVRLKDRIGEGVNRAADCIPA